MKSRLAHIIPIILITVMVFSLAAMPVLAQTAPATATTGVPSTNTSTNNVTFYGLSVVNFFNSILASLMNTLLSATGFLLTLAAALLNVSIVFTLHIRDFVNSTPAIYTVWQTIRDITGLFFIFFLLYAAIRIILDMGSNQGKLIMYIVVAGILINFSFFIVSVLIDASNVVSQAIFNSMVPSASTISITSGTSLSTITSQVTGINQSSGSPTSAAAGISNVFLNSLKIQSLYDTNGNKVGTAVGDPFKIVLIGVVGIIIMITAALSFLLAAVAFIARLVILIFLLAFSPIWFAGWVIPQLKEKMGEFQKHLTAQLIFMPVYLLLMYAAMSVLNNSNLMGAANATTTSLPTGSNWAFGYMVLAINFVIVIFMLNLPLVVGLAMGGAATKFISDKMGSWNASAIWKKVGAEARMGSYGRLASAVSRSEGLQNFAARSKIGELALKGIRGTASDYNKKLGEQVKSRTQFAESLGFDQGAVNDAEVRLRRLRLAARTYRTGTAERDNADAAVRGVEREIVDLKNARKQSYADRIGTYGIGDYDTMWTKVARKNKAAAAKINIDVWESQSKDIKDALKDSRNETKQINNQVNGQPENQVDINTGSPTRATEAQQRRLAELSAEQARHQSRINDLDDQIAAAKLIK